VKQKWFTLLVCAIVALTLLLYLFSYQTQISEGVVQRRLGKVSRVVNSDGASPGWYFRMPYPIDEIYRYDRRLHVLDSALTEQMTNDKFNINVRIFIVWRILDPVVFQSSVSGNVKTAEERLKYTLTTTKAAFSNTKLEELVNTDKQKLAHKKIEDLILARLQADTKQYGIEAVKVGITRLNLPSSTTLLVFSRMRAERKRKADAIRTEGQREATIIRAEAEQKKRQILAEAQATALVKLGEGEAAEAQYYDVFAKAPELATFLRNLEALRKIAMSAKQKTGDMTLILDTKTPPFSLLREGPKAGMPKETGPEKGK